MFRLPQQGHKPFKLQAQGKSVTQHASGVPISLAWSFTLIVLLAGLRQASYIDGTLTPEPPVPKVVCWRDHYWWGMFVVTATGMPKYALVRCA